MSIVKLKFLVASLVVGVFAGCASVPATQSRATEEPAATEYRHVTGSHIRREVPVGVRYMDTMHPVRIIDEAEMRKTGSNNVAEILHRSGVF